MENWQPVNKPFQDDKFLNALAEAFRLQEAIINTAELAIISTTPEGIINSFNPAAEKLFGFKSEQLIDNTSILSLMDTTEVIRRSDTIINRIKPDAEPAFQALTYNAREVSGPHVNEWTMVRKNSVEFPASISLSALRDDDDGLLGFVFIVTDLTELKKKEEQHAIEDQKFRLLAENIPGVIYLCKNDEHYSMIYLNDAIEDLTGHAANDFTMGNVNFAQLFHPDDRRIIFDSVDEALRTRQRFDLKYRIKHKSGEWRWVEEVGVGVYANDKLLLIEGFIRNITKQQLAEEKLQKVAEENLKVFNNPVSLHCVAGFDGYFKRLSPSWTNFLGWSEDELKSRRFIEFVHPEDVKATADVSLALRAGENVNLFENRYLCKDGSYRWLLWGSSSDIKHELIYASAIDITERKRSEEELLKSKISLESIAGRLQEQNRQLDEFAHIISHNLRSPVANIQALIGLLSDESSVDDYKLIFDKLKNVSKNLSETMSDLMDTMKVRENTSVEKTELRFKDILDKVVQSLEGDLILAEASVTFDFNSASTLFYPKAYLESIFQNLLTNALKYRSPMRRPMIHFTSLESNGRIELRVRDNGLGIDMEKFGDKLFGLHKTFHAHEEARGVGLFLIKTQVEAMGGSISAESQVDHGTTFIIRF